VGLPADFSDECLYDQRAWLVDDVQFFKEENRLEANLPTTDLGTFLQAQRTWPLHDKHVPGAVMVQVSGVLGQLYAAYLLDMRATDGWVGFGTHIKNARFARLGEIGPAVTCHVFGKTIRKIGQTTFTTFNFRYDQDGEPIYESTQIAAWVRSEHRGPLQDVG
jgi:hypothetical protein